MDHSIDISEIRNLTEVLVHLDECDTDLYRSASPYLIRILQEKTAALEDKYLQTFRAA